MTGCNKRVATDIVTSFLANGIAHVGHFELSNKVFDKAWSGTKMYHDLIQHGVGYYEYDDFSVAGSTVDTIRSLQTNNSIFEIANKAIARLATIRDGIDAFARRQTQRVLWRFFFGYFGICLLLISLIWKLGWDVMEPWTYIIGGLVTVSALGYFVATWRELTPSIIFSQMQESYQKQYRDELQFEVDEFQTLQKDLMSHFKER